MQEAIYFVALLGSSAMVGWIYFHLSCTFHRRHPPDEPTISWARLKKEARTGDVIVFSGGGSDSVTVRAWSGCPWTHVGMIVRDPDAPNGDGLYLWNADPSKSRRDVSTGLYREGVQLNDLLIYLATSRASAYFVPLLPSCREITIGQLLPTIRTLSGIPFHHDWLELLRCTQGPGGGPVLGSKEPQSDSYFCSQLVAETLYNVGVMGDRIPFNEYHPRSFIGEMGADWLPPYGPGEPQRIVQLLI